MYCEVLAMKFKIPKTPSSTNKSIRFPNAIRGQDCTFSAFVVEAVRVALENLQDDED